MPRYSYMNDPADYYQNSGFDAYTGRLNGGQLVMAVLAQLAAKKKQEQQDKWDLEGRQAKQALLDMQRQGAALDLEGKRREAKDYESPAIKEFKKRIEEKRRAKADIEKAAKIAEINKNADIAVNQAKPAKTRAELDKDYLNDVEAVTKQYAAQTQAANMERLKQRSALYGNKIFYEDEASFLADMGALEKGYTDHIAGLDKALESELASIDERYADLPRSKASKVARARRAGQAGPVTEPAKQKIAVAGKKKRADLPKGSDVRVAPDGRRLVKIGGVVYEVTD